MRRDAGVSKTRSRTARVLQGAADASPEGSVVASSGPGQRGVWLHKRSPKILVTVAMMQGTIWRGREGEGVTAATGYSETRRRNWQLRCAIARAWGR